MAMISSLADVPEMGQRVRLARKALGLRRADLAKELEIDPRTVTRWERGNQPRPRNIRRLDEFFDTNGVTTRRGIFCLETVWFGSDDRTSVKPAFELLDKSFLSVPFLHYNAVTKEELHYHLDNWANTAQHEYPILYLSYHGVPGHICVWEDGKDNDLSMRDIAETLEGQCKNRVIHFASCGTLRVARTAIMEFLDITRASAVSGYKSREIDWIESMALELLYLEGMQSRVLHPLSPYVMKYCREQLDGSSFSRAKEALGFRIRTME